MILNSNQPAQDLADRMNAANGPTRFGNDRGRAYRESIVAQTNGELKPRVDRERTSILPQTLANSQAGTEQPKRGKRAQ
jgi:hypothetical protein